MTGYKSKKAAALDKLDDDDTQVYIDHGDALTAAYMSGYHDGKKAAQPAQELVANDRALQLEIEKLKDECTRIYRLLALAHLNLRHHMKYGFNPKTAQSTLISVGQYYPKLKAKMEENT